MPHPNELDHVIEDGAVSAICPYCDKPIVNGPTETYGGLLLHATCYEEFGAELLSEDAPNENEVDYAYRRYYGF